MEDSFTQKEFDAINECLKSGFYTQGKRVEDFEEKFAEWNNGLKYGVMVNSGSSANLLMVAMLKEKYGLKKGDEVLVPAVTWPTTVYPLIQYGLTPVFCDVDESFNISINSMKKMFSEKTKAVFLVHLLGQPADMAEIQQFCNEKKLLMIEDNCESLGAVYDGKKTGAFGEMSSFSFYFGHHITTIEGGMILTNNKETADLLKSVRSHGWVRKSMRAEKYKKQYKNTDFLFDMLGYNLRSSDLNAAIGLVQLEKLNEIIDIRKKNHALFQKAMDRNPNIKLQQVNIDQTSSFCFAILLNSKEERDYLLQKLPEKGIECRPIVAGNLLKQPVFTNLPANSFKADDCQKANEIHNKGLYLPNNQFINEEQVNYMVKSVNELLKESKRD